MPLPFAQRPLTLPRMALAPEAGIGVNRLSFGAFRQTRGGTELGARFGILDEPASDGEKIRGNVFQTGVAATVYFYA